MLSQILMVMSGVIILALGSLHLIYTFRGSKLLPRDPQLQAAMNRVHLRITRETTVWRAWVGFNASHSMGAILFGLIYAFLALFHPALLFGSAFLLGVGLVMLAGLFVLAKVYWFSRPFVGISVSLVCYVASLISSRI